MLIPSKNVNMQLHACEGPSPFSPFRVLAAMATDASVCDAHREARGQKVLPGAFPFLTSHRLVGSARADPSPFTAPTVAIPKVHHSHKGQARGRGLRATSTPPGCGLTFWNAFHFEQWSSFFIVYNFHRSIHPTVTLIHSTNGFLFLPCPFSELFEICFRDVFVSPNASQKWN
jgi:hypothetical protein